MEKVKNEIAAAPILFPYEPENFWIQIRLIISEEIEKMVKRTIPPTTFDVAGMNYKPLYKIGEVCTIFKVTKPTIYDWIKHGKLKPFKVRSRVYFLWNDIEKLFPQIQK
jgi:predicted DNA-binding transcriptional regulator AlpA